MIINKSQILSELCYTELVYGRINKKLKCNYSKTAIEKMLFEIIEATLIVDFQKIGKNYYISNTENNIKITINSNTFRVITVNRISKL